MIGAIHAHAPTAGSVRLVRLVLFGRPAYHAFVEVAAEILGPPLERPPRLPDFWLNAETGTGVVFPRLRP